MKEFLTSIPRVWKGGYMIWVSLHFILLMISGDSFTFGKHFYPFYTFHTRSFFSTESMRLEFITTGNSGLDFAETSIYDLSEFFTYTMLPILLALIIYYLKPLKDKDGE